MAKDAHNKAAEHHENAAKSHRMAAEHHGKGDHATGMKHSATALDHANKAHEASKWAHEKSGQQKYPAARIILRWPYRIWQPGCGCSPNGHGRASTALNKMGSIFQSTQVSPNGTA